MPLSFIAHKSIWFVNVKCRSVQYLETIRLGTFEALSDLIIHGATRNFNVNC